jgi:glycerophosphoryl diester phosphodiesterase
MKVPVIQAHRGFSARYPENTCLAFTRALDLDIEGIELDVQLTSDRVPVVIHDPTVDRTTDGRGRVNAYTAEALAKLNAAGHSTRRQSIPTLAAALDAIYAARPDSICNIELKVYEGDGSELVDMVLPVVQNHPLASRVCFSSFRHGCLAYLKHRWPEAPIGLLYDRRVMDPWRRAQELGAVSVNLRYRYITPELIADCHRHRVQVAAWTVDNPESIHQMLRWNVDTIISNRPDVALRVRNRWIVESEFPE